MTATGMKKLIPLKIAAFERPFILKIENKGLNGENCYFAGTMGCSANDLIKYGKFNCNVVKTEDSEGYGHMDESTMKYNGMNGALQSGGVDLGLAVQMIPMENDDFLYGPVVTTSRITILSSYATHNSSHDEILDVAEIFATIDWQAWLTFAMFLIVFSITLFIGKRLLNTTDHINSFWTIVTFACGRGVFGPKYGAFFRCFILFLSLFIFLSHQYFCNYMTTELVRPNMPHVIDSFEDILRYRHDNKSLLVDVTKASMKKKKRFEKIHPHFLKAIRSIKYFQNAKKGSIRRRIYDYAIKVNGGREKSLVDFQDSFKPDFVAGIFKGTNVIIDAETIARMIRVTMCESLMQDKHWTRDGKPSRLMLFARNASIPYLLGYVYSRTIKPEVRDRLDSIIYRFAESGIAGKLVTALSYAITQPSHAIERCLKDEILQDISEVEMLEVKHVLIILKSFGVLVVCALICLIFEYIMKAPSPKRKKSSSKKKSAGTNGKVTPFNRSSWRIAENQLVRIHSQDGTICTSPRNSPEPRQIKITAQFHHEM